MVLEIETLVWRIHISNLSGGYPVATVQTRRGGPRVSRLGWLLPRLLSALLVISQ
jgi:hypothetical protein